MPLHTVSSTPYPELNSVLTQFLDKLRTILGDHLIGLYLQGSFALGDFDEHSDVDFIVVTTNPLTTSEVEPLQLMHKEIYHSGSEWAKHLEGSYFPLDHLRQIGSTGTQLWYLDHGAQSLIQSEHCDTLVVRRTLRSCGRTLFGPVPQTFMDPVPTALLRQEIYDVMKNWGAEILADPSRFRNRFYQGFIVLSYCRMLHDLTAGELASKQKGAEWAKDELDPKWRSLIDRAWDTRPDPATSVRQQADPDDFAKTRIFLEYILELSSETAARFNLIP
ncbi:MAG: aminoglycoside adenylyltransferase domain-containing protein [Candidatus Promineifilaceae bacterium]